jgi:hypothetical protein
MSIIDERLQASMEQVGTQFLITYSLKQALDKFGKRAKDSTKGEMGQMVDREAFVPIRVDDLNPQERKRAMESLLFLVEKKDGRLKARHCANGSTQRGYIGREEASSPTVSTESILLTAVIEAEEGRDVATMDIPNAFIQTEVSETDKHGNKTIMKIRGVLVDILCEMKPEWEDFVTIEKGKRVLYMHILKAIYGMLVSAMLFYQKLSADLVDFGFEINPYDPCVANKVVEGKQLTVCWHIDDLKASHMDPTAIDSFAEWAKKLYGSIGELKVHRGKIHEYLGMKLDSSEPGKLKVDMVDYVQSMLNSFPQECHKGAQVASPWNENLFKVHPKSPKLPLEQAQQFHTTTAQALFLCKRARPDICPAVAYLTTRVQAPNEDDWSKLCRNEVAGADME